MIGPFFECIFQIACYAGNELKVKQTRVLTGATTGHCSLSKMYTTNEVKAAKSNLSGLSRSHWTLCPLCVGVKAVSTNSESTDIAGGLEVDND